MATQAACIAAPARLMQMSSAVVLQQTLYAAAKLGLADLLEKGLQKSSELAAHLNVHEPALLRAMRFLAGQGVFEEPEAGVFKNNEISHFLRFGVHGSLRSFVLMRGSNMFYAIPHI